MDDTTLILNRVLPILLLIALGHWTRRSGFLTESAVENLRKLVVTLALPAVLFISFLEMKLQTKYLLVFVLIFVLNVTLFALGRALKTRLRVEYLYFPFLMTGFEYGMLGVSLFGSAYGLDKIGYIAVIDLGHELFIWFVFLAFLLMLRDGHQDPRQLLRAFLTSPVIIGILAGIALNVIGAREFVNERPVVGGVMATLRFLGDLTIPLILIIVGYGIRLDRTGIREAAPVIGIRLAILVPLALLLNRLVLRGLLDLEAPFEAGLFTLLVLPPPFIIPLYMKAGLPDERRYVNNALTLYTVASIALFTIYFVLHPEL
ncbi:MAG: auxin efflux carrier [Anaerolineae bacterium]